MKKFFRVALFSSTLMISLFSCKDSINNMDTSEVIEEKSKIVSFKGLNAKIPYDYPDEVFNLTYDDLRQIGLNSKYAKNTNLRLSSGSSLEEITENVKKRYPNFDTATPDEYKKFFPELTTDQIIDNREIILQYIESLIGYESAISYSALGLGEQGENPSGRTSYETNSCEEWYYVRHARLDRGGMETAMNQSFAKAGYGHNDRSDANRHAVWNVYLGKYAAYRYGDVPTAMGVVMGLTQAHECDTPDSEELEKNMDLFNNLVGLQYYTQIAQRYKKNIFDHNVRVNQSDDEIFSHINSLTSRIITNSSDVQNQTTFNVLVRIQ